MKKNKVILSLIPFLILTGCASPPPVLHAARALIDEPIKSTGSSTLPKQLSEILESQTQGYTGQYNNIEFTLGKQYTSALGESCTVVYLKKSEQLAKQERRAACKNANQQWVITPQVIENKNNQISFGA
mgnify:CR=1 FL=1